MTADPPDHVLTGIHEFGSTALAYTHDGQHLISGGYRGDIRVWDARTHQPRVAMHGHRKPVRALLPLPSGYFVSGGDDGRLILWHQGVIQAQHEGAGVTALALFQGRVISGHDDGRLRIWSTDALRAQGEIPMPEDVVALSVQDAQMAVGLDDRIVVLGPDLRTVKTLPSPHTPHDLQFSPDGRLLAAGSWFRLSVWDMASGKHRTIPTEHNGLLTSVAFSPDGRLLATLGRHTDSAIRLFDTHDFKVIKRYQAHDLCGALIRFSPDGRTLATASDDESVRLHRLGKKRYPSSGAIPPAH